MTDIDKLRKLLAVAPPAPWVVEERDGWWEVAPANSSARTWPPMAFDDGSACGEYSARCSVETRDLIVAAVNALPELLDEIERLKARVGWLDHLDTEEGRKTHANEALLVEIERLKAELGKLKECTP